MSHFPARLCILLVVSIALGSSIGMADSGDTSESSSSGTDFGRIEILDERLNKLIASDAQLEILANGFQWTEGPLWLDSQQKLVFSDVPKNTVFSWSEEEGIEIFLEPAGYTGGESRGGGLGSNGLALDKKGQLVLCQHGDRRIARMTSDVSQPQSTFETLAGEYRGKRFNSPNDLALDTSGNLYFTDPPYGLAKGADDPARELDWSGIYRLAPDGQVFLLYQALSRPNGIALSPDEKTLYVANSDPEEATWTSFRIEEDGSLGKPFVFHDATGLVKAKPGLPDGLKVDSKGNIFATGPGGIFVFSPKGDLLGTINTGEPTANLAFNTDESMLYITANDKLMRLRLH
jgi:gluconolactonase